MTPKLILLILTGAIVLLGTIPSCVCRNYEICNRTTNCGDRVIRYPFWGEGRPESCGYPGFQLTCRDEYTLLLNMSSISYRVLDIDYSSQRLLVSRNDLYYNNLCRPSLLNTTLNFTIFNFSSINNYQNITLFYGCQRLRAIPPMFPYEFSCEGNSISAFYTTEWNVPEPEPGAGNANILSCNTNIIVPVTQTAAGILEDPGTATRGILEEAIDSGFWIRWNADNINCDNCTGLDGSCGRDLDSNSFACYDAPRGSRNLGMIIGLSLGLPSIVAITFVVVIYIKKQCPLREQEQENQAQAINKVLSHHGSLAPKWYSYNQIKKMTKSFSEKLGRGAFGTVYKGMLPDDSQLVAVKVLIETDDNITEDFINEVSSISKTSHVNIVNLLGFCYEGKKRALVYEFMPNKSLDNFISKDSNRSQELEWEKMYEIAVGIARGLEYLHRGCNTRIVHFDIKPQNILLDKDFCPKISDFGLAKLFQTKQSMISMLGARGTIGYIAPEVFSRSFGVVSHKSDVYSYGMMLLEMAGAKKAVEMGGSTSGENFFHDKIYKCVMLDEVMAEEKEESVRKMLLVGVWCIQIAAADRPSMTKVLEMLEGSVESIQIPPKPCWN